MKKKSDYEQVEMKSSILKKLGSQVVRKEYGEKESRIQLMLALRPRGPRDLFAQLPTQLFFR